MEEKKEDKLKSESKPKVPKVFLSPAFLIEVEHKLFGLYRSIEVEEFDRKNGHVVREKIKNVGPIALFRECEGDEKEDLLSFHPTEKRPMRVIKIN